MTNNMDKNKLSVSLILEWDNVRLSELGRCRQMLEIISGQAHQLRHLHQKTNLSDAEAFLARFQAPVELIVLYDSEVIDGKKIEEVLNTCIAKDNQDFACQLVEAPNMRYFALKNFGATHAKSDFIIFLDSDVIPEDDWLLHMLSPFADEEVKGVSGNAYIDYYDLYSKAFALCWFFPLRTQDTEVYRDPGFFANNLAFRSEVFQQYPFPVLKDATRRSCVLLSKQLEREGVLLVRNPKAQVAHPPPNGLNHFLIRGLALGRDNLVYLRQEMPQHASLYATCGRLKRNWVRVVKRTLKHRKDVQLSWFGVPVVMAIAFIYYLFYFFGEVLLRVAPQLMREKVVV